MSYLNTYLFLTDVSGSVENIKTKPTGFNMNTLIQKISAVPSYVYMGVLISVILAVIVGLLLRIYLIKSYRKNTHGIIPKKKLKKAKNLSIVFSVLAFVIIFFGFKSEVYKVSKVAVKGAETAQHKVVSFFQDHDTTGNYEDLHENNEEVNNNDIFE